MNAPQNPPSTGAPLTADALPRDARACVVALSGDPAQRERLTAMGLGVGAVFEVLRAGSGLAVRVGESRLALGREWAAALHVVRL